MVKFLIFCLVGGLIYSAMTLITVRYEQRLLFTELEKLSGETKQLETRWRFLELERANLTNTISLDHIIRDKFKMVAPAPGEVIYIQEKDIVKPDAADAQE